MKMPFGKHKGEELEDIIDLDFGYFVWLTTIELRGKLKEEVDKLKEEYKDDIVEYNTCDDAQNDAYLDYIIMDRDWQWK